MPGALLDLHTVKAITGLSTATVYRRMADKQFPQAVRLGRRCTRWPAEALQAWARGLGQRGKEHQ